MRHRIIAISLISLILLAGCTSAGPENKNDPPLASWDDALAEGKDKTINILMWGGNEAVNRYMDGFVAKNVKELYGITLRRVPMNAPEYISKLLNEKKAGLDSGTADLLWINAENFKTAKQGGLLWGPFTYLLPNLQKYYNKDDSDLIYDTGIPIEGYEAIWGRAQLVFSYDSKDMPDPPRSFEELLAWVMKNPSKFTYPRIPDDFVGVAFIRTAYYELTGERDIFQKDMTKDEFQQISKPVIEYFQEMNKYLWREGKAFPATQAHQDELFKNGELALTMGFEIGKTSGRVLSGEYPESVRTYLFDTGTIGNSHYLAVPFNAPQKAGALLVIDFLQSPEAQIEKLKAQVWGDMPAIDVSKLSKAEKADLKAVETSSAIPEIAELSQHRLPEMQAQYIEWIKEIWTEQIGGK